MRVPLAALTRRGPNALKAADSETLGGKPAFALVTVDAAAATSGENKAGAVAAATAQLVPI